MSRMRRLLAWLKLRERPISAGVALLGFAVAALSMVVALFQAALLYSQRATPYETAIYVRQLEVTANFVGAAYEQNLRLINLRNDCIHRINGQVGATGDYLELARDFRSGAEALHIAYGATLATFPPEVHERARQVYAVHEQVFDQVVAPARDCHAFLSNYRNNAGAERSQELHTLTRTLVNSVRAEMSVDELSWPAPVREAVVATAKPEDAP